MASSLATTQIVSNFDEFQGIFLFWSIVLSGAGFFFPAPGFFFPAPSFSHRAPGKKTPAPGKKTPAPGKKNPAPESTMDQNRKIP